MKSRSNPPLNADLSALRGALEHERKIRGWTREFMELTYELWEQSADWIPIADCSTHSLSSPAQVKNLLDRGMVYDLPRIQHPQVTLVSKIALELKFGTRKKDVKL